MKIDFFLMYHKINYEIIIKEKVQIIIFFYWETIVMIFICYLYLNNLNFIKYSQLFF